MNTQELEKMLECYKLTARLPLSSIHGVIEGEEIEDLSQILIAGIADKKGNVEKVEYNPLVCTVFMVYSKQWGRAIEFAKSLGEFSSATVGGVETVVKGLKSVQPIVIIPTSTDDNQTQYQIYRIE